MNKLDDLITIGEAAKRPGVKMHPMRLRQMCINAGIAVKFAGTEARPILKVRFSDVEKMILDNKYSPVVSGGRSGGRTGGKLIRRPPPIPANMPGANLIKC